MLRPATSGWASLPQFSKALYKETYFLPNENYEGWVDRIARAYQNDEAHGDRISAYIQNYWFHPSTPIASNAGTDRGLPISCFTKSVLDTKPSIFANYNEAFNLGAYGGGIGTVWSSVREVNHPVGPHGGTSSGIIPFMGISDRSTLAISQGGNRRASEAAYLSISHPEIEEFIDLRKPTGDQNRRAPNLHHGIAITDAFMRAVITNADWELISPKNNKVVKTVKARALWEQILDVRTTLKGEHPRSAV
jgi:ribonucleoside-diphosphate reductase alpha chain